MSIKIYLVNSYNHDKTISKLYLLFIIHYNIIHDANMFSVFLYIDSTISHSIPIGSIKIILSLFTFSHKCNIHLLQYFSEIKYVLPGFSQNTNKL